jgi:mediator of RNA polymerase II transcription subunit 14
VVKLAELENATPGNTQNPAVHAHHVGKFRISYANPLCSFDIKLKEKDEKIIWNIVDNHAREGIYRPAPERNHVRIESLKTAIKDLFKDQGPGWYGVGDSIIAELSPQNPAVEDALQRLHDTVLSCAMEGGYQHQFEAPAQDASTAMSTPKHTATPQGQLKPLQLPQIPPNNSNNRPPAPSLQQRTNFPGSGLNTGLHTVSNAGAQPGRQGPSAPQDVIELD